jgi:hypothetical protein
MDKRDPVKEPPATKRLGNGVVQRALVRGFAVSTRTMDISEAQRAVETVLGGPMSRDSVNSCLSTGARGPAPRFERVAHGRYRLVGS